MENIFTRTLTLNKQQVKRFKEVVNFLEFWQANTGRGVSDFEEIKKLAGFELAKQGHKCQYVFTCEKSKNNGKTYWSLTKME